MNVWQHTFMARQRKHLSTKGGKFSTELWQEYSDACALHGPDSKISLTLRNKLVEQNRPLVVWQAEKFKSSIARHCDLQDLIQTGCVALIRVIERFDPSAGDGRSEGDLGTLFTAFAIQHILSDFRRVSMADHVVHKRPGDSASKAEKGRYVEMRKKLGREPTREEFGPNLRRVENALAEAPGVNFMGEDKDNLIQSGPVFVESEDPEKALIRREQESEEFLALAALPREMQLAVTWRCQDGRTFRWIAKQLALTDWHDAEKLVEQGLQKLREQLGVA